MTRNNSDPAKNDNRPENENWRSLASQIALLSRRASSGDRAAMSSLRQLMTKHRDRLSNVAADLCLRAEASNSEVASFGWADATAAVLAYIDTQRDKLSQENDSPIEHALVNRIGICWLALYTLEQEAALQYSRAPGEPPTLDKAIDRAHHRLARAINELARVRRVRHPLADDIDTHVRWSTGPRERFAREGSENE